jgi:hypothetical protein
MVNLSDFKYKETTRHGKSVRNKLYRHTCDKCGSDRGYQSMSFVVKSCNKCSHKNTVKSEETKNKMSLAAIKRYNDPNWKPQEKKPKSIGQRRSVYKKNVSDIHRKIYHNTKTLLWQKLKNHNAIKLNKTFNSLGYSVEDLKNHLESKFESDMSWDNYGKWHIDHIIPDSWFKYNSTNDQSFKESWSLENLQPLWAQDNLSKSNRRAGK